MSEKLVSVRLVVAHADDEFPEHDWVVGEFSSERAALAFTRRLEVYIQDAELLENID